MVLESAVPWLLCDIFALTQSKHPNQPHFSAAKTAQSDSFQQLSDQRNQVTFSLSQSDPDPTYS